MTSHKYWMDFANVSKAPSSQSMGNAVMTAINCLNRGNSFCKAMPALICKLSSMLENAPVKVFTCCAWCSKYRPPLVVA